MPDLLTDVQALGQVFDDLAASVALGLIVERAGDARGATLAADAVVLADQIQAERGLSPTEIGGLAATALQKSRGLVKRVVPRLQGLARSGSLTWITLGTIGAAAYVLTSEERVALERIQLSHEALADVAASLTPEQRAQLAGQLAGQLAAPLDIPWAWIIGLGALAAVVYWRTRA